MSAETRDAAIRDAKRHVYEVTRNDWTFEPSSPPSRDIATHTPADPEQEWQEWRLREHDSSGSELQPQPSPTDVDGDSSGSSRALGTRESRRKRRRQVEEEEMRWNVGLRTWVERRDAWTGARRRRRGVCGAAEQSSEKLAARTEASLAIAERESRPGDGEGPRSLNDAVGDSAESVPTSTTPTSEVCDPLIPVAPSFIPQSNPVRASITPALYPSIYSKVVVQGLTPTVPINLADVTKAMVQGWKSDGQWPPKPTSIVLPDDSIARKSGAAAAAGDKQASPESKKRSSVASAVKKVLHFSGFHPRPFHRRGSSHGGHSELHDGHKDVGPAPSPPGTGHSK